ncbi:MAG: DUF1289 domain-containing protein [Bacteroidales bacterium]|nr:DUF1289 domain-containing protein [Bacteroidales bacterium]
MKSKVESPCINVCKYDEDHVCMGCHRTMTEITQWLFMNDEQKEQSIKDAKIRKNTPRKGENDYDYYV